MKLNNIYCYLGFTLAVICSACQSTAANSDVYKDGFPDATLYDRPPPRPADSDGNSPCWEGTLVFRHEQCPTICPDGSMSIHVAPDYLPTCPETMNFLDNL